MAVILEMLFGVEASASRSASLGLDAGRFFPRPEPRLARLGAQDVVGIELGAGLREGGRGDYLAWLRRLRVILIMIDLVGVSHRAGKHHDMTALHGESVYGHWILLSVGVMPRRFFDFQRRRTGRRWAAILKLSLLWLPGSTLVQRKALPIGRLSFPGAPISRLAP